MWEQKRISPHRLLLIVCTNIKLMFWDVNEQTHV